MFVVEFFYFFEFIIIVLVDMYGKNVFKKLYRTFQKIKNDDFKNEGVNKSTHPN